MVEFKSHLIFKMALVSIFLQDKLTSGDITCLLPVDAGPCTEFTYRYYYDYTSGLCKSFAYGGCEGNSNNFFEYRNCSTACKSINKSNPRNGSSQLDNLLIRGVILDLDDMNQNTDILDFQSGFNNSGNWSSEFLEIISEPGSRENMAAAPLSGEHHATLYKEFLAAPRSQAEIDFSVFTQRISGNKSFPRNTSFTIRLEDALTGLGADVVSLDDLEVVEGKWKRFRFSVLVSKTERRFILKFNITGERGIGVGDGGIDERDGGVAGDGGVGGDGGDGGDGGVGGENRANNESSIYLDDIKVRLIQLVNQDNSTTDSFLFQDKTTTTTTSLYTSSTASATTATTSNLTTTTEGYNTSSFLSTSTSYSSTHSSSPQSSPSPSSLSSSSSSSSSPLSSSSTSQNPLLTSPGLSTSNSTGSTNGVGNSTINTSDSYTTAFNSSTTAFPEETTAFNSSTTAISEETTAFNSSTTGFNGSTTLEPTTPSNGTSGVVENLIAEEGGRSATSRAELGVLIFLVVGFALSTVFVVFKYYHLRRTIGDYSVAANRQNYDNPAFNGGFGIQENYRAS